LSKNIDHVVPLRELTQIMIEGLFEDVLVWGSSMATRASRETKEAERDVGAEPVGPPAGQHPSCSQPSCELLSASNATQRIEGTKGKLGCVPAELD